MGILWAFSSWQDGLSTDNRLTMRLNNFLKWVIIALSVGHARADCRPTQHDLVVEIKTASADVLPNLFNSEGTIRYEFERMLTNADQMFLIAQAPKNICNQRCNTSKEPEIVFSSKPKKFLKNYRGAEKCAALHQESTVTPIHYRDLNFENLEDFLNWFEDFSQGRGTAGKDLYQRCGGACSPQYQTVLSKQNAEYLANISVVCGHARDKLDNDYEVTVAYRWNCR